MFDYKIKKWSEQHICLPPARDSNCSYSSQSVRWPFLLLRLTIDCKIIKLLNYFFHYFFIAKYNTIIMILGFVFAAFYIIFDYYGLKFNHTTIKIRFYCFYDFKCQCWLPFHFFLNLFFIINNKSINSNTNHMIG